MWGKSKRKQTCNVRPLLVLAHLAICCVCVQCVLYRGAFVLTNAISISSELLILYLFKICCIQTDESLKTAVNGPLWTWLTGEAGNALKNKAKSKVFANWAIFIEGLLPDDFRYWLMWGKYPVQIHKPENTSSLSPSTAVFSRALTPGPKACLWNPKVRGHLTWFTFTSFRSGPPSLLMKILRTWYTECHLLKFADVSPPKENSSCNPIRKKLAKSLKVGIT